jgi:hypothetical protein
LYAETVRIEDLPDMADVSLTSFHRHFLGVTSLSPLQRLLDRPEDIPVLAPAIEREILWRLINGQQGAMVRQIGLADSRMTLSSGGTDNVLLLWCTTSKGISSGVLGGMPVPTMQPWSKPFAHATMVPIL